MNWYHLPQDRICRIGWWRMIQHWLGRQLRCGECGRYVNRHKVIWL